MEAAALFSAAMDAVIRFGSAFAFVLAAGQLVSKRPLRVKAMIAALFMTVGLLQLSSFLFFSGLKAGNRLLAHTELPLLFCLGPLLYLSYGAILKGECSIKARSLLHFIPTALGLLLYFLFSTDTRAMATAKLTIVGLTRWSPGPWGILPPLVYCAAILSVSVYTFLFMRGSSSLWNAASFKREPMILHFFVFLLSSTLFLASSLTGYIVGDIVLEKVASSGVSVSLVWIYLLGQRFPSMLSTLKVEADRIKYEKSRLLNMDVDDTLRKLDALMKTGKAYRDDGLTLAKAARSLSITPHQLSELLNDRLGKSFKSFLNEMRVAEAKDLLAHDPKKPVLTIALEVGFSSQSAFYDAFLQFTGMTPKEFRKIQS